MQAVAGGGILRREAWRAAQRTILERTHAGSLRGLGSAGRDVGKDACVPERAGLAARRKHDDVSLAACDAFSISSAARARRWTLALAGLGRALSKTGALDAVAFGSSIDAFAKVRHWRLALWAFGAMSSYSVRPNQFASSAAIGACATSALWQHALGVVAGMQDGSAQPNLVVWNGTITACEKGRAWRAAVLMLGETAKHDLIPDHFTFNATISACGRAGHWQMALKLREELELHGRVPNIITFNALASALEKGSRWKQAVGVLHEVQWLQLLPSKFTYGAAVAACEKGSHWEGALSLLTAMQQDSIPPGPVVVSAAITACANRQQWQHACSLFQGVVDRRGRQKLDVVTLGAFLGACAKAALWEEAIAQVRAMCATGIEPNNVSLSCALSACSKATEWEVAVDLYQHWETEFASRFPCPVSLGAVMAACSKAHQWMHALAIWTSAEEQFALSQVGICAALQACAVGGQWEQALSLLGSSHRFAAKLDQASFCDAVAACERGTAWEAAVAISEQACASDPGFSTAALGGLVRVAAGAGQWEIATHVLGDVRLASYANLDDFDYGAGLSACRRASRWREAGHLVERMRQAELALGVIVFNSSAAVHEAAGCMNASLPTLYKMRARALCDLLSMPLRHVHEQQPSAIRADALSKADRSVLEPAMVEAMEQISVHRTRCAAGAASSIVDRLMWRRINQPALRCMERLSCQNTFEVRGAAVDLGPDSISIPMASQCSSSARIEPSSQPGASASASHADLGFTCADAPSETLGRRSIQSFTWKLSNAGALERHHGLGPTVTRLALSSVLFASGAARVQHLPVTRIV